MIKMANDRENQEANDAASAIAQMFAEKDVDPQAGINALVRLLCIAGYKHGGLTADDLCEAVRAGCADVDEAAKVRAN